MESENYYNNYFSRAKDLAPQYSQKLQTVFTGTAVLSKVYELHINVTHLRCQLFSTRDFFASTDKAEQVDAYLALFDCILQELDAYLERLKSACISSNNQNPAK